VVNELKGAPNRNSGEHFMLVWIIEDVSRVKEVSKIAGMSVVSCIRILGGVHTSVPLSTYRNHPGLLYRLGSNAVNLSFGLHAGWAIEGAVGTEFKIDASYLSPNVSIAESVERATQSYGVSVMVAKSVVELCPEGIVKSCRLIDKVIIPGSKVPVEIYCVDLDIQGITMLDEQPLQYVWNTRNRFKVRQYIEAEKTARESVDFDVAGFLNLDPIYRDMRKRYDVKFFQLFSMGYHNYSEGEWSVARRMLSCTRAFLGAEDGPSIALLKHMASYNFQAPPSFHGVRELDTTSLLEVTPERTSTGLIGDQA